MYAVDWQNMFLWKRCKYVGRRGWRCEGMRRRGEGVRG